MTADKLLEAFASHSREAKRHATRSKTLQRRIVEMVLVHRAKKDLRVKDIAAQSGISLSRLINLLYNGAAMKPSEAKSLLQAING